MCKLAHCVKHVGQVSMTVAAARRSSDCNEDRLGAVHALLEEEADAGRLTLPAWTLTVEDGLAALRTRSA